MLIGAAQYAADIDLPGQLRMRIGRSPVGEAPAGRRNPLKGFPYSDEGQPLATSLADCLMPALSETPDVEAIVSEDAPSPLSPFGVKGGEEGGTTEAGAAILCLYAIDNLSAVTQFPISTVRPRELIRRQG